jgi:hypothetical protein
MEISRRIRITFLIGILVTLLFGILMWIRFPPGEVLEEKLYDYRFKIRGAIKPSEHIVIAAIDEKSIGRFGRWPWSRDKIAQIESLLLDDTRGTDTRPPIISFSSSNYLTGFFAQVKLPFPLILCYLTSNRWLIFTHSLPR